MRRVTISGEFKAGVISSMYFDKVGCAMAASKFFPMGVWYDPVAKKLSTAKTCGTVKKHFVNKEP